MRCQLIAGAALMLLLPAYADAFGKKKNDCPPPCCDPCPPVCCDPCPPVCCDPCPPACPPAMKTIKVCEMVPTWVEEKRTVCKDVWEDETYTAYKCIQVPETKTREVTVNRVVKETVLKPVTKCCKVPYTKTVVEYETKKRLKKVEETYTSYERKFYKTTQCVEDKPGLLARCCGKGDDCCPSYKTKTTWHSCKEPVCKTRTRCRFVEECVPVCKEVTCYRTEYKTEMVPECITKCIPETKIETYTVCTTQKVPYEATRKVCKKIQVEECVKVCKLVPTWKEIQVPDHGHGCGSCCGGAAPCHGCTPAPACCN